MKLCFAIAAALANLVSSPSPTAQDFGILNLDRSGTLSWEGEMSAHYDVEWAPRVDGPWSASWDLLRGIPTTNTVTRVSVPMFFRVVKSPPAAPAQIEMLEVPSDGRVVVSDSILRSGRLYHIEVFGIFRYDVGEVGQLADAQHIEDDSHRWRRRDNVALDGSTRPADAVNLPHHSYTFIVHGAGHRVSLRIQDDNYGDNHGFLYARILDVGEVR